MGCQVSRLHEPLEGQLGLHQPDVQVLADRSAVMDTTNAIESLNRERTVFPNAMGLTKALYLATWELTKKMDYARSKLGGQVYAELAILYPGRLSARSTPTLTERQENAMLIVPTATGIRTFIGLPSVPHFSIFSGNLPDTILD